MINSNIKTFRLSRSNKLKGGLTTVSISGLLTVAAIVDNDLGVLLFALPIVFGIASILIFSIKLEISDEGAKYSDLIFTITANWDDIEKITTKGMLTHSPALVYKKWAILLVWRTMLVRSETEFVRTINLQQFERNWLRGELGKEVSKYVPELIADL